MASYSDTHKTAGENIKNILSEEQLLAMEKAGTVPPNEEFFTPEDDLDHDKAMILNWIYPVGIILQFAENVDPNAIMPGQSWEKIEGKFLLASDSSHTLGAIGGEATHTLTIEELANHRHMVMRNPDQSYKAGFGVDTHTGTIAETASTTFVEAIFTDYVGLSQPHNNMPPYLVVNVWKRIA